mmetsp:Transcript_2567/g.4766  ORF Transcript_2567/g.4766 Transcript_2567/m.4766 type:complete len:272 (+) Transcript_2567:264-1079(+)
MVWGCNTTPGAVGDTPDTRHCIEVGQLQHVYQQSGSHPPQNPAFPQRYKPLCTVPLAAPGRAQGAHGPGLQSPCAPAPGPSAGHTRQETAAGLIVVVLIPGRRLRRGRLLLHRVLDGAGDAPRPKPREPTQHSDGQEHRGMAKREPGLPRGVDGHGPQEPGNARPQAPAQGGKGLGRAIHRAQVGHGDRVGVEEEAGGEAVAADEVLEGDRDGDDDVDEARGPEQVDVRKAHEDGADQQQVPPEDSQQLQALQKQRGDQQSRQKEGDSGNG